MESELLNQLEGWTYKQMNGIDVLIQITDKTTIGIELIRDIKTQKVTNVNGFVFEANERYYEDNRFSLDHKLAISIVEGYYYGNDVPATKPNENIKPIPKEKSKEIVQSNHTFFPESLTQSLIDNHPGPINVLMTLQNTDEIYKKERKGKGGMVVYVEGNYVIRALNFAFLFDWSFEIIEVREEETEISVLGKLTVNVDRKTITKTQFGVHERRNKMSVGDTLKSAATDSLKKCASQLGIAQDIYSA